MATIRLDSAEQAYIDEQVKAGAYKDVDAVMHEALGLLRKRDAKTAKLRALIQEGVDDFEAGRYMEFSSADELTAYIIQTAAETR